MSPNFSLMIHNMGWAMNGTAVYYKINNQRRSDNRAPLRHYYIPRPHSHINLYIEYEFNYMKGTRMSYLLWALTMHGLCRIPANRPLQSIVNTLLDSDHFMRVPGFHQDKEGKSLVRKFFGQGQHKLSGFASTT